MTLPSKVAAAFPCSGECKILADVFGNGPHASCCPGYYRDAATALLSEYVSAIREARARLECGPYCESERRYSAPCSCGIAALIQKLDALCADGEST